MIKVDGNTTEISGNVIELLSEAVLAVDGVCKTISEKTSLEEEQLKALIFGGIEALGKFKDGEVQKDMAKEILDKYFKK